VSWARRGTKRCGAPQTAKVRPLSLRPRMPYCLSGQSDYTFR